MKKFTAILFCQICVLCCSTLLSCYAYTADKTYEDTVITPKFKISKEDLEYGKNELRQVLRDRPQMCELVKEGDPIWLFAAKGFAGELSSSRLKWNSNENFSFPNQACYYWGGPVVQIYSRRYDNKGKLLSAQECWCGLIYEIFNSSRFKENHAILRDAISGKCSRDNYIKRMAKLEYLAELQHYGFFKKIWRPRMVPGKTAIPIMWHLSDAELRFDDWYAGWLKMNGTKGYPCGFFGKQYDQEMARVRR